MRLFFCDEPHAMVDHRPTEFNMPLIVATMGLPYHPAVMLIAISHRLVGWC